MMILPGFRNEAIPSKPKSISSTSAHAVTIVMMISACSASSFLLLQTFAPSISNSFVRSFVRFHTKSSRHLVTMFFAMGTPMRPSPINPIFIKNYSLLVWLNHFLRVKETPEFIIGIDSLRWFSLIVWIRVIAIRTWPTMPTISCSTEFYIRIILTSCVKLTGNSRIRKYDLRGIRARILFYPFFYGVRNRIKFHRPFLSFAPWTTATVIENMIIIECMNMHDWNRT